MVSFSEGVEVVSQRVLTYTDAAPYIATIRGMSGIGKSHFGREVVGKLYFQKSGTFTKPHDLGREKSQKGALDYVLLEIDQFDNGYDEVTERKTRDACGKIPDYRVVVVYELGPLLDEKLTLARMLTYFDLVVENKEHPDYR